MFVPSQVSRTIIGSNTYSQVQQRLQSTPSSIPPPPIPPFIPAFGPSSAVLMSQDVPEKNYSTEPTPVVLSSAPKLYTNRPTVSKMEFSSVPQAPAVCCVHSFVVICLALCLTVLFMFFFLD